MIKDAILNFFRVLIGQPAVCKETTLDGSHRMRLASMRSRRDGGSTETLVKRLSFAAKVAEPLKNQRETCEKVKAYLFGNDRTLTGQGVVTRQALNSCCESLNIPPDSAQAQPH